MKGSFTKNEDAEAAVKDALQQVNLTLAELAAKVVDVKPHKFGRKVTLQFGDVENRNVCRWALVDREDSFKPKAHYDGEPVGVWCKRPRFEVMRDDRLYYRGRIAAVKAKVDFKGCTIDKRMRLVIDEDGNIIAHQCRETWEAHDGCP